MADLLAAAKAACHPVESHFPILIAYSRRGCTATLEPPLKAVTLVAPPTPTGLGPIMTSLVVHSPAASAPLNWLF